MKDCSLTASTVAFSPSLSPAHPTNGDGGPGGEFAFSLQSKRPAAECLVGFISAKERLINCTLLNSRTQQSGRQAGRLINAEWEKERACGTKQLFCFVNTSLHLRSPMDTCQ